MPIEFTIPYPPSGGGKKDWCKRYSLNALYAGLHWSVRKRNADTWHALTRAALQQAGLPRRPLPYPVEITFYYDDGLDVDNHAYMSKMILDGCKGWLVEDDSRRYVKAVTNRFSLAPSDCIRVEVLPYEH